MDYEKLIERLKAKDFERDYDCTPFECGVFGLLDDAATALSMIPTLQAENKRLQEMYQKEKAVCHATQAELEQMSACVYYKAGGLCRYWGDDPVNFCTLGACPLERSAQEVLAELEQVKRALAMMWFSYVNSDKEMPHSYETDALDEAERILGPWAECMPKYLRRGQKED